MTFAERCQQEQGQDDDVAMGNRRTRLMTKTRFQARWHVSTPHEVVKSTQHLVENLALALLNLHGGYSHAQEHWTSPGACTAVATLASHRRPVRAPRDERTIPCPSGVYLSKSRRWDTPFVFGQFSNSLLAKFRTCAHGPVHDGFRPCSRIQGHAGVWNVASLERCDNRQLFSAAEICVCYRLPRTRTRCGVAHVAVPGKNANAQVIL